MENKDFFYHHSSVCITLVHLCIVLECLISFLFEFLEQNLIAQTGIESTV